MGTDVSDTADDELGAIGTHRTVTEAFCATVHERGAQVALRWRDDGEWKTWTWSEYAERAARVAAGLRELGVERGARVLLMMRNRPEFHIADMAAQLIGATPFSVYNSSAPEQLEFIARHSSATVAVVESTALLERFLAVRASLPSLRNIVVIDDLDGRAPAAVVHLSRLLQRPPIDWERAAAGVHPDDLVTLIYTSGATGPPKGVMLTHENVCWTVRSLLRALARDVVGKRFASYLPMAHVAERIVSHYIHVDQGTDVSTCLNPARIAEYLREVRPQIFFAVPRVWEKAHSTIAALATRDPEQVDSFRGAIELGRRAATAGMNGEQLDAATRAAWKTWNGTCSR